MSDRIADVWGPRTPHPRGSGWPARVDLHLEDGLTEADVERWVQSACVLCSNGCGCEIAVRGNAMVGVRGVAADVSAPTVNPAPTPTSSTATRSFCTGTIWPRHRPCCGLASWTGPTARIRRSSSVSTPGGRRWRPRRSGPGGVHLAPQVGTNLALMNGLTR
jgi:hypothetical protein